VTATCEFCGGTAFKSLNEGTVDGGERLIN